MNIIAISLSRWRSGWNRWGGGPCWSPDADPYIL